MDAPHGIQVIGAGLGRTGTKSLQAALDLLGPAHKWTTELHAVGDVEAGTLNGDLVIKGGGDPFLVLEEIWKMLGGFTFYGRALKEAYK